MKNTLATFILLSFGVVLLTIIINNRPDDKQYTLIEQQKTLQIEAQARAIETVADHIPSMWPVVFLSCVGFLAIVTMMYLMYRINQINLYKEMGVKQTYINKELEYHDYKILSEPARYISIEDIRKMRLLIQRYDGEINNEK